MSYEVLPLHEQPDLALAFQIAVGCQFVINVFPRLIYPV